MRRKRRISDILQEIPKGDGKMKKWQAVYNGNVITVENGAGGERLLVNDVLQDEQRGFAARVRLWGRLDTGEEIKVSLGGWFIVNCRIFVGCRLMPARLAGKG